MANSKIKQGAHLEYVGIISADGGYTFPWDGILKMANNPKDINEAYAAYTNGSYGAIRVNSTNGFENVASFPVKAGTTLTKHSVSSNSRVTFWYFRIVGGGNTQVYLSHSARCAA